METHEFYHFFNQLPSIKNHFKGVFPIDKLPFLMKNRTFIICNLDPSWQEGSHWIAFFKTTPSEVEIFDSLGFKPEVVIPHLKFKKLHNITYNENAFQNKDSILCGKFCIMFCIERLLNPDLSFFELLEEIFDGNVNKNDQIVTNFYQEILSN